jgi:hypothetical protein
MRGRGARIAATVLLAFAVLALVAVAAAQALLLLIVGAAVQVAQHLIG